MRRGKIIEEFKPDIVIGTGGYVCAPVIRAAHKRGVRAFIHEQNAPGVTNKFLEKYVEKVFISFKETQNILKNLRKLFILAIQPKKFPNSRGWIRKQLGISPSGFCCPVLRRQSGGKN